MNARIFTGTLEGHTGKFVTEEVGVNLQTQIDLLLEGLGMVAQAHTLAEAVGIASDVIDGNRKAVVAGEQPLTHQAYPLDWPLGWPRAGRRTDGLFRVGGGKAGQSGGRRVELDDGLDRVFETLKKMGVKEEHVTVSSNVKPRLGSRQGAITVQDPGVCVYWTKSTEKRCMAIDQYLRVPDNIAAIAATLEAMRAIERYGGAEILERAFTGFNALPAPEQPWQVLGVGAHASREEVERAYRLLASEHHPDKGGDSDTMARLNLARDTLLESRT